MSPQMSGTETGKSETRRALEAGVNIQRRLETVKTTHTNVSNEDKGKDWKPEDGMTESIMSTDEDKQFLEIIKKGRKDKKKKKRAVAGAQDNDFFEDGDSEWKERREKILGIIENLSEYVFEAHEMKMSKLQFIDALRAVQKDKILSIEETKEIFEKGVDKLIRAQEYEMKQLELLGIRTAQDYFRERANEAISYFNLEKDTIKDQFRTLDRSIAYYQKTIETQNKKLAL